MHDAVRLSQGSPGYFTVLVVILGGLFGLILLRTLVRIVQLGPVGWARDAFRIDDDFWRFTGTVIWLIVAAMAAAAIPSGMKTSWPW